MIAHINARMMIFGDCVQTTRRRCRQFRNKCFGYKISHVNRSWKCRLYCISSSLSKIHSCDCGSRCAGSPRGCSVCRRRMFFKSWRRSVKLWDRSQERDYWRTVEQIVQPSPSDSGADCGRLWLKWSKSSQELMCQWYCDVPSTDHPDSSEDSGGSTSVAL